MQNQINSLQEDNKRMRRELNEVQTAQNQKLHATLDSAQDNGNVAPFALIDGNTWYFSFQVHFTYISMFCLNFNTESPTLEGRFADLKKLMQNQINSLQEDNKCMRRELNEVQTAKNQKLHATLDSAQGNCYTTPFVYLHLTVY